MMEDDITHLVIAYGFASWNKGKISGESFANAITACYGSTDIRHNFFVNLSKSQIEWIEFKVDKGIYYRVKK